MPRRLLLASVLSTLALVAAGCFRSESPTASPLPGTTPTPTATPTPGGTPTPTPTPGGTPTPTPTPFGTPTPTPPPTPTPTPPPAPTLSELQSSIFTVSCALSGCHAGASPQEGMSLEAGNTWSAIVNVTSTEQGSLNRVTPGDPNASYLIRKLEGGPGISGQQMPRGGPFLSAAQIQRVRDWVTAGALNN